MQLWFNGTRLLIKNGNQQMTQKKAIKTKQYKTRRNETRRNRIHCDKRGILQNNNNSNCLICMALRRVCVCVRVCACVCQQTIYSCLRLLDASHRYRRSENAIGIEIAIAHSSQRTLRAYEWDSARVCGSARDCVSALSRMRVRERGLGRWLCQLNVLGCCGNSVKISPQTERMQLLIS